MFAQLYKKKFAGSGKPRAARKPAPVRPRLENLEDRLVRSTFSFDPVTHIGTLTGTSGNDALRILYDGNGHVAIFDHGVPVPTHSPAMPLPTVGVLRVDTQGGDDTVKFALTSDVVRSMRMIVDLGE